MIADIKLSPEFKAQTTKAIMSIVLFVIIYCLLILMAIGLTILCLYAAMIIIITRPGIFTIVLGVGIGSMGVLILIFLFKFIFKSHKVDRSHLLEISRNEEPQLFSIIDEIVKEVNTTFPKKVYLSSDVNASVFYDSSFWSMFFPVRKNLQIGLGLVNSVSKEELKSILAHEFGHFSQKTMKVGSYVYHVNQVIYNMLYDNEGYDKLIQGWANINAYIALFVVLAIKIIGGIQWILQKMYELVNKSYMSLSREMEFHADEIAANVTGYEPLKNSLLRLELANHSYNSVLSFYETKISDSIKSENLFKEHSFVMNHLANEDAIPIKDNLPQVTMEELNRLNKSKLVIKDQWASHPSTAERIKRLESLNVPPAQKGYASANTIFKNIEATQKALTEKIFSVVNYKEQVRCLPLNDFKEDFQKQYEKNTFAKLYNGYYDNKNPIVFEPDSINSDAQTIPFNELYSQQKVDLVYTAVALENDLGILKQISDRNNPVKTFDYDGKKYKKKESNLVINALQRELKLTKEQIKQNDIDIFKYFKSLEPDNSGGLLKEKYKHFFAFEQEFQVKYKIYENLSNELQFINFVTPVEQIQSNFQKIKSLETELKKGISDLLNENLYQAEISEEIKGNFDLYTSKEWQYFGTENYFEKNLEILYSALNNYVFLLSRGYFLLKKDLLNYQEKLHKGSTTM